MLVFKKKMACSITNLDKSYKIRRKIEIAYDAFNNMRTAKDFYYKDISSLIEVPNSLQQMQF